MSWKASAYVSLLTECPDGSRLTRGQKLLLLIIADAHNEQRQETFLSVPTLALRCMCSIDMVKMDIRHMVEHRVLWKVSGRGSGNFTKYGFPALDGEAPASVSQKGKPTPPFCPKEKGEQTVNKLRKNSEERVNGAGRNKEEPQNQNLTREPHACGALTKGELDLWLAVKEHLRSELAPEQWDLWVRPMRLLRFMSGAVMQLAVPPSGKVIAAAKEGRRLLAKVCAAHGLQSPALTTYPDDWQQAELAERFGIDAMGHEVEVVAGGQ